jgi:hypothetical protein
MDLDPKEKKQYDEMCRVKDLVADDFLKRPDVTGIGVGLKEVNGKLTDELAIIISVKEKKDVPAEQAIPVKIKGFVTDVFELDPTIEPEPSPADHKDQEDGILGDPDTDRYNPLKGGISIGPITQQSAGTLGIVVEYTLIEGFCMLLTCYHVLVNAPNDIQNHIRVCQPGRSDDNNNYNNNVVGYLNRAYLQENYQGLGGIDCAVTTAINRKTYKGNIVECPCIKGDKTPDNNDVGETVFKRGRTTGKTEGTIRSINYDSQQTNDITLESQIEVTGTDFSDAGDSGSVYVLRDEEMVIGLHCRGDNNHTQGIANPINAVKAALSIEIPKTELMCF